MSVVKSKTSIAVFLSVSLHVAAVTAFFVSPLLEPSPFGDGWSTDKDFFSGQPSSENGGSGTILTSTPNTVAVTPVPAEQPAPQITPPVEAPALVTPKKVSKPKPLAQAKASPKIQKAEQVTPVETVDSSPVIVPEPVEDSAEFQDPEERLHEETQTASAEATTTDTEKAQDTSTVAPVPVPQPEEAVAIDNSQAQTAAAVAPKPSPAPAAPSAAESAPDAKASTGAGASPGPVVAVQGGGTGSPAGTGDKSVQNFSQLRQYPGNQPPRYLEAARLQQRQGKVQLVYDVTAQGTVSNIRLVKSSGYKDLDQEAHRAISQFRFYPGQQGSTFHEINFKLVGSAQDLPSRLRQNAELTKE